MKGVQQSTKQVLEYAEKHPPKPKESKRDYFIRIGLALKRHAENIRWILKEYGYKFPQEDKTIEEVRLIHSKRLEDRDLRKENRELMKLLFEKEREFSEALAVTKPISTYSLKPRASTGTSEAVAVVLASDWHIEEKCLPEWVNGLNEYNLDIAHERAERFFKNVLRMIQIFQKDIRIDALVLFLGGDFFSSDLHPELPELNQLQPMEACLEAQKIIASGIQFILDNSKLNLVIPTASGNHARTTEQVYFSTEAGHSMEYYMYQNLAHHFEKSPRVKFLINKGYFTYLDVFGYQLRFHHGHSIKYQGGVGGLYIPVNKAIAQWNKGKPAYCDFFGHWHSQKDGGNFVSNGSLIGFNAYALRNKFDFEVPKQAFCLIHKGRGKGLVAPIWLDR